MGKKKPRQSDGRTPTKASAEAVAQAVARGARRHADELRSALEPQSAAPDEVAWAGLEKLEARDRAAEEALSELRSIRAEGYQLINQGALPTLIAWWRDRLVPTWNRLYGDEETRMCVECGCKFAPRDRRDRFCSERCGNRARNRGRERVGNGHSSAENARRRVEERLKQHLKGCSTCNSSAGLCPVADAMMAGDDALSRRSDLSAEDAEGVRLRAGSGRVRPRGTGPNGPVRR